MRILFTLLLSLFSLPLLAADGFAPYWAKYEVRYNGFKVGELVQRLAPVGPGRQGMQTRAYTTGVTAWFKPDTVTEKSEWRYENGLPVPLSYEYRHKERSGTTIERIDFDWENGVAEIRRKGKEAQLPVVPGTMDRQMYQIALRHDLSRGKTAMNYPVVEGGEVEPFEFQLQGEEALQIDGLGKVPCVKVQIGTTHIWAARHYDYLPMKIEKSEENTTVTTQLLEYRSLAGGQ